MKLSQSVALGAALAAVPLVVGLTFTIDRLQELASQSERLMLRQLTAVRLGTGVAARLDSLSEYQRKFAVSHDPGYAQKATEVSDAIDEEVSALIALDPGTAADAGLAAFVRKWRDHRAGVSNGPQPPNHLLVSLEGVAAGEEPLSTFPPSPSTVEVLANDARALLAGAHEAAIADVAQARRTREDAWRAAISATLLALFSSASLLILVVRNLRKRLDGFVDGTVAVSQGAFSAQLPVGDDELGRVATAFNRMVTALAELDRLKSDFISSISHELRTPLVAMVETNEALLDDVAGPLTDKQRRMISLNAGAARRLSVMIGDLLELSVVRSGLRYRMAPTELTGVIQDAVSELESRARERRVTVRFDVQHEGQLHLEADRDRLAQVVQNLVENAIKYTPSEGTIEITLTTSNRDGLPQVPQRALPSDRTFAVLRVVDSGPGIPAADRERVFEKFFRRQGVSADGVGLGLAICREIAYVHRGAIWIEDGWLGGACLGVALPVEHA